MKTETTIDEQNEAIRNRVDAELPRPIGGFESSDQEDAFRATQDSRFLELCAVAAWGEANAAVEA